ncbi:MAG TPA: PIG-L family deacetylase [Bryobacteraceae bacterium]|jgi:LmbE family N-acetylglucosaminyl deacetylase
MKILAVGAHPDDVEFGCAPVLIQEVRNGHEARILVTSKGEAASAGTPEERAQEARDAARVIGAAIQFLDLGGDCHIQHNPATAMLLALEIRRFKPDVVLAPHLGENQHPDHAAVGKSVRDAARLARYGGLRDLEELPPHPITSLYYYAITQVLIDPPQLVVDVSGAREAWEAAIACHQSQMKTRSYPDLVLSRARAIGASIGVEYAVGLWLNDPVRVASLADLGLSSRYF